MKSTLRYARLSIRARGSFLLSGEAFILDLEGRFKLHQLRDD